MLKDLMIREETPSDYKQTELMIMRSFLEQILAGMFRAFFNT